MAPPRLPFRPGELSREPAKARASGRGEELRGRPVLVNTHARPQSETQTPI